jgi:hypothetical protein
VNDDDIHPPDDQLLDDPMETEELPPQAPCTPPDFRERLVLALRTTDTRVLDAAESCYVGRFPSVHAFIVREISEHLPEFLLWLAPCLDPEQTRRGYEGGTLLVWTIALGPSDVLVFQSLRVARGTRFTVAGDAGERVTVYAGDE